MAKIRIRIGSNEIEIDSRDFYIDNDTASQVIADLAFRLQENASKIENLTRPNQKFEVINELEIGRAHV